MAVLLRTVDAAKLFFDSASPSRGGEGKKLYGKAGPNGGEVSSTPAEGNHASG